MAFPTLPRLRLLAHSQLGTDTYHSLVISLLRGMAALQVAAGHLRNEFMPSLRTMADPPLWYQGLAFATGFTHQAVVVFFLISGWLVGGSLLNRRNEPEAFKLYAIDRLTRFWTVLIPTLLLSLAFAILTGKADPGTVAFSPANPYSFTAFIGNLASLQTVSVPQFAGNYPLWSLANEGWYYLLFPILLAAAGGRRRLLALLALAAAVLFLPADLTIYFSIWLLGALFSRVRLDCGGATRLMLLVLLSGLSLYYRFTGSNDDLVADSYVQDLLLSLPLLLLLSSLVIRPSPVIRLAPVRRFADFFSNISFTLYVVHVPVLGLLAWLGTVFLGERSMTADHPVHLLVYLAMLAAVVLFAWGFYRLFEARTGQVRRWLKQMLLHREPGLRAI